MGTGIGIVAARTAGINVKFIDAKQESLKKSEEFLNSWIKKEIEKQRMTEDDKKNMLSKIQYHDNISKLNDVDFAIEVS
jgi:3-hydroxybutyryl-CoA dehydrogenase